MRTFAGPCPRYPCPHLRPCPIHRPVPFAGAKRAEDYGPVWRGKSKVYLAKHRTCEQCGAAKSVATDHIKARALGGTDEWDNMMALCVSCHAKKTGREAYGRRGGRTGAAGGLSGRAVAG